MPEALVAALDQLSRLAHVEADRPGVPGRARPPAHELRRAADAADRGQALLAAAGGRPGPAQARGPQPHRLAQDQQRDRAGAARPADGQDRASSPRPAPGSTASRPRRPRRCFGLECTVYMGEEDTRRQALNVSRMRLLGAEVVPVTTGHAGRSRTRSTRRCATGWRSSSTTHYIIGTRRRPAPVPDAWSATSSASSATRPAQQCLDRIGRLPDAVVACVGGGSNAIGHLLPRSSTTRRCALIGVEAGGDGVDTGRHAAHAHRGQAGRPARRPVATSCRTTTARPRDATRSPPGSTTRASAPSTRGCTTPAGRRTEPHRRRGDGRRSRCWPDRGHHPARSSRRTPSPARCEVGRELGPDARSSSSTSPAGATRTSTRPRAGSASRDSTLARRGSTRRCAGRA